MKRKRTAAKPNPAVEAILRFDLTTPEGRDAHKQACAGANLCSVLWEMDQYLRNVVKHNVPPSDSGPDACEAARSFLHEQLNERGLVLDDLVF